MKISGNCWASGWWCPNLCLPRYHAGYTGKSGIEASHYCKLHRLAISDVKSCELAGGKALTAKDSPESGEPLS